MSILSEFTRSVMLQIRAAVAEKIRGGNDDAALFANHAEILVTGRPPSRMATFRRDRFIGRSIRRAGHFEESLIAKVHEFIGHAPGRTTFLDVGANIGTHALFSLRSGFDRVICIEPDPDNFMLLRINQILNGVDEKCINIMAAASSETGEMVLELSETNLGDHRIRTIEDDRDNRYNEQARRLQPVSAAPLDALLAGAGAAPESIGLAWIDTQGHEGQVLAGAKSLTDADVPIVLEFWPYGLKRAGGYGLLRAFLAEQHVILDIRKPLAGQEPLSLGELDRYFEDGVRQETGEVAFHTDLLVRGKPG